MIAIDKTSADGNVAAEDLRAGMQGKIAVAGEEDYARVRYIWNGAVEHQPRLFALCESAGDVQAALRVAHARNLSVSVRGGGHDCAGGAFRHEGMVIDLTRMRQVNVDPRSRTATIGGGTTGTDVTAAVTRYGLAAVTGNVGTVGMAGFLLGGGYGPLTTRFGLGLDNLLGAEVVLADGRILWADDSQNQDLFWAIRGGGGNFGVVTSMRIRLHAVNDLLAGMILFPWDQAKAVLRGYAEIMASAPEELSVLAGVFSGEDGSPLVLLGPVWSGKLNEGKKFIARLQKLGTPLVSQVGPMNYPDILRMYNAKAREGLHYAVQTRWLPDLTPEIVSSIIKSGEERTSPLSFVAIHHFHGAGTTVAADATAFHLRKSHFLMEIGAAWDRGTHSEATAHRKWMHHVSSLVAPFAMPGGYPNFLTQDDSKQVASAYGENAQRLRDLKRKFDPENVFSSTTPLPL